MARPIRSVDRVTAARLSASQAIPNVAAVVKELLENAIDAGAASVRLVLTDGGATCVSVVDDGSGIALYDDAVADTFVVRRGTSKRDDAATPAHTPQMTQAPASRTMIGGFLTASTR